MWANSTVPYIYIQITYRLRCNCSVAEMQRHTGQHRHTLGNTDTQVNWVWRSGYGFWMKGKINLSCGCGKTGEAKIIPWMYDASTRQPTQLLHPKFQYSMVIIVGIFRTFCDFKLKRIHCILIPRYALTQSIIPAVWRDNPHNSFILNSLVIIVRILRTFGVLNLRE